MSVFYFDTIMLSKIAIHMAKKDTIYIDESIQYLNNGSDEQSCIKLANVLFPYFVSQYKIASTDNERRIVVGDLTSIFNKIFAGKYIPSVCWELLIKMRSDDNKKATDSVDQANEIVKQIDASLFPITASYFYRKIASYIVNGGLFFIEPYTTILDDAINKIDDECDTASQPNFLA